MRFPTSENLQFSDVMSHFITDTFCIWSQDPTHFKSGELFLCIKVFLIVSLLLIFHDICTMSL